MNPDRGATVGRLAELIVALERAHPVRVCVDGVAGAGKTSLANDLAPAIRARAHPCIRASADGFHRPRSDRYRRGRDSPEGYYRDAFDYEAMRRMFLDPLGPNGDRRYQPAAHDVGSDLALSTVPRLADRRAVVVVDGMFLQRPELDGCWDFRVWVDCSEETARARAVSRDRGSFGPQVDALYRQRYLPAQRLYLDEVDAASLADARFVNNDPDHPVLVVRR
ncbi:MAG: hypothetical protein HYU28_02410 [Actinobacteria bacterium]|nr:hypothetical protein [Actinomycetota bacterium]